MSTYKSPQPNQTSKRRDDFAAAALTGLCGHEQFLIRAMADANTAELPMSELIARATVKIADAVIAELDKPPEEAKPVDTAAEQ